MTHAPHRSVQPGRRLLAVLAIAALAVSLLAPSGAAQDPPDPRTTLFACPAGQVPDADFPDPSPTFQRDIDCIVAYEIVVGRADGTYGPLASVTRGQMATFVRNLVEEAGVEIDTEAAVDFPDIAGSTHEGSIRAIANTDPAIVAGFVDGTYRPNAFVRRDQMATYLATAHEVITGEALPAVDSDFTDITGNVHADNIERLAGAGITVGTTATTYAPRRDITRGQMAAFFARHLDILVEFGVVPVRFPVLAELAIDPEGDANFVDDDHEFTVLALDQTGTVFDSDATVYYEVYAQDADAGTWHLDNPGTAGERTAGLDAGEATFSYTRPEPQAEAIVACLLPPGEDAAGIGQQDESMCVVTDDDTLAGDLSNLIGDRFATAGFKDWLTIDRAETVRLNWQTEIDDDNGPLFGDVDDFAAGLHEDGGSGLVTITYNVEAGYVETSGSTLVTSAIPDDGGPAGTNHHIHVGSLDENGPVGIDLPTPGLEETILDAGGGRGIFEYSLDGSVRNEQFVAVLEELEDALAALEDDGQEGVVDWYVNVHTVANPAGEVRGQIARTEAPDGGLSALPPVYKLADPAGDAETIDALALAFDIPVGDAGDLGDVSGDFTVTVNDDEAGVTDARVEDGVVVLAIEPQDVEPGDVYAATIGDAAAAEIVGDDPVRAGDATGSVRTRTFQLVEVAAGGEVSVLRD